MSKKDLVAWEEELAQEAKKAKEIEAKASTDSNRFTVKSGVLHWKGAPVPNNKMLVVIMDSVFESAYYEDEYDPENPAPPTCFAIGRDPEEMEPHETVVKADQQQSEDCEDCPHAEWGSADKGKGKACKQTRRLALIVAGTISKEKGYDVIEDEDHYNKSEVGILKLPITSVRNFSNYVSELAEGVGRPPHFVFTEISAAPHPRNQYEITFRMVEKVSMELAGVIKDRKDTSVVTIVEKPYDLEMNESKGEENGGKKGKKGKKGNKKSRKY